MYQHILHVLQGATTPSSKMVSFTTWIWSTTCVRRSSSYTKILEILGGLPELLLKSLIRLGCISQMVTHNNNIYNLYIYLYIVNYTDPTFLMQKYAKITFLSCWCCFSLWNKRERLDWNHSLEGRSSSTTVVGCSEAAPARIVCSRKGARFRDNHTVDGRNPAITSCGW